MYLTRIDTDNDTPGDALIANGWVCAVGVTEPAAPDVVLTGTTGVATLPDAAPPGYCVMFDHP